MKKAGSRGGAAALRDFVRYGCALPLGYWLRAFVPLGETLLLLVRVYAPLREPAFLLSVLVGEDGALGDRPSPRSSFA